MVTAVRKCPPLMETLIHRKVASTDSFFYFFKLWTHTLLLIRSCFKDDMWCPQERYIPTWKMVPNFLRAFARCLSTSFLTPGVRSTYDHKLFSCYFSPQYVSQAISTPSATFCCIILEDSKTSHAYTLIWIHFQRRVGSLHIKEG